MALSSSLDAPKSSRLVQFLTELALSQVKISHKNFAEELGQLIDLSDSFALSESLRSLNRTPFTKAELDTQALKADFLQQQSDMVENLIRSFTPEIGALALHLPKPEGDKEVSDDKMLEAYKRFYALQQSDMDYKIIKLRGEMRLAIKTYSESLAQLVALDTALSDTLTVHSRRLFTLMPRLLAQRYAQLRDEAGYEWRKQFYKEMQSLLLAELDVRLQPVLGLIEALDDEVHTHHD